jgi:phosphoribosyl 1,2-cyclic phosphodiesterase
VSDPAPSLRILGSGSSGNAAIIDLADDHGRRCHILLDLGLGPRTLPRRAASAGGFDPDAVLAVLVTHADQDHLRPSWSRTLHATGWPVHALPSHHVSLVRTGVPSSSLRPLADHGREIEIVPGVVATTAIAPHDDHGTATIRLRFGRNDDATTLGWATDLGRVTPAVEAVLEGCDVLAIESNYDPHLQSMSDRPPFLKHRITSGHGHLSNEESIDAVLRLSARHEPSSISLLHLSRDCNHPDIVDALWRSKAPHLHARVRVTHAERPVGPIRLGRGRPTTSSPVAATLFG